VRPSTLFLSSLFGPLFSICVPFCRENHIVILVLKSVGTVGRRMSKDLTKKLSELKDSALDSGSPLKRILSPSSTSTSSTSTTNNEEK